MRKTTYRYTRDYTIGTTATQVLKEQPLRSSYRIIASPANIDNIYHGENSLVSTSSIDILVPGSELVDEGTFVSIYKGEVWLISGTASQSVTVIEKVAHNYPAGVGE